MPQAIGKYRWTICALVFFATTINYLDGAVISLLKYNFIGVNSNGQRRTMPISQLHFRLLMQWDY